MVEKSTLILFTGSYPYNKAAEDTFLNPEIEHLLSNFDNVIIIPGSLEGGKQNISNKIEVEERYAKEMNRKYKFKKSFTLFLALKSTVFYKEILYKPEILYNPRMLLRLIAFVAHAEKTQKWLTTYIKNKNFNLRKTIFYTYWLDSVTTGIGLVKKNYQNLRLISRAHGYDLYEERAMPPYIPCRLETLKMLDKLFMDSENGKNYIAKKYPVFNSKYQTSRLGIKEPDFISEFSKDGVFRIVSCSFIVPVKRIDLLLNGIVESAKSNMERKFEWHHIGEGPLKPQIEELAKQIMPKNVKYCFLGRIPEGKVMSFYKENPVDVFINVSSSEGTPVSIMEAQSCGIPAIATSVGGNPEIVSDKVGILLNEYPPPKEIGDAISIFLENPETIKQKRKASKANWQENYNADKNFALFADELIKLIRW